MVTLRFGHGPTNPEPAQNGTGNCGGHDRDVGQEVVPEISTYMHDESPQMSGFDDRLYARQPQGFVHVRPRPTQDEGAIPWSVNWHDVDDIRQVLK